MTGLDAASCSDDGSRGRYMGLLQSLQMHRLWYPPEIQIKRIIGTVQLYFIRSCQIMLLQQNVLLLRDGPWKHSASVGSLPDDLSIMKIEIKREDRSY
jgi:hypothetical protein